MSKNNDLVAKLAQMLQESKEIEEIEVASWWMFWRKWRIKRSPSILVAEPAPAIPAEAPPEITEIKSTLVGWFHHNETPLAVGDEITPGTVVCMIKSVLESDIESEIAGKIIAVEVEEGQAVEYGQILFRVELT